MLFVISFYIFLIGYTFLFGLLFQLDFNSFDQPLFYVFGILSIIISTLVSFLTQVFVIWIVGIIRVNKNDPENKFNHAFGVALLVLAIHILRLKVKVTGKENIPDSNFVLMGNHQEIMDVMILKPIFKKHTLNFIAKESLFGVPIIGRWITILGNIPISKYADRSAAESIVKGIREVKKGRPIAIFPEGKRSFGNEMIEFKPGAFKLAMKPKADILLVTLYDLSTVKFTIPLRKQHAYVHVNGLLKYEDYKELNSTELAEKAKSIIQKQLDIFNELYKK